MIKIEDRKYVNEQRSLMQRLDPEIGGRAEQDDRKRSYILPKRVLWKTESENARVKNEDALLEKRSGQITLNQGNACVLENKGGNAAILLDFGVELQGGIQILTWSTGKASKAKIRVRFGESAMEAMSEIGESNSTNDHAIRDLVTEVSFLGIAEIGTTGFRFVRIDLMDEDSFITLKSIKAVFVYKDIEYKGSFRCSDELLNKIWNTGAYTVHLNMQHYLWDGIKRDRLVWIGDMHPETSTIQVVFGCDDVVPKSLDLIRDDTKLPGWMNGIPSYSMWWIKIHRDWYMHNGNTAYLGEQREYLLSLLEYLIGFIGKDGRTMTPNHFIDWPSSGNENAVEAGVHSLLIMAMEAGAELCSALEEKEYEAKCCQAVEKLRQYLPSHGENKQAAALMALAGLVDKVMINKRVLSEDGARGISTFLGYYVLKARGLAGDIQGSLDVIRQYWGAMLALGATTFWEDFNLDWIENAARIDELTPEGKIDVHGCYGDYCYKGFRHSLCHGWASGPTAWLSEAILGVRVLEAGCKKIQIIPALGDLEWAQGTYPTPLGVLYVRHERQGDGSIKTVYQAPEGVEVTLCEDSVL